VCSIVRQALVGDNRPYVPVPSSHGDGTQPEGVLIPALNDYCGVGAFDAPYDRLPPARASDGSAVVYAGGAAYLPRKGFGFFATRGDVSLAMA
jgi:hypothetical protein